MAKRFFTKEELDNIIKDYDNGNGLRPFELAYPGFAGCGN